MELGTHQELLELEGYYYKLYTLGFAMGNEDEVPLEGYVEGAGAGVGNT